MDASALYKAGQVAEAIDAQIAAVKASPLDQGKRLFLFELLVFAGDLDRAQKHIEAVRYEQPELDNAVAQYRQLLDSERARRQALNGKVQPQFLAEPPEHAKLRILGLVKLNAGAADAGTCFTEANSQIGPIQGTLNGKAFATLRDGDDRLGSILEVHAHGRYFWVPLEQVAALAMNAPRFPRDLVWIPAHLQLQGGEEGPVFLPALYPGSDQESDTQLKLGRLTDWRDQSPTRGVGAKIFYIDGVESCLLDWRRLEVSSATNDKP
ncbi:MAG: type VI secretion system protein ImpE [Planctomycetes bacterium]|nr:type VI secretion system protein ImpE [Planctomycetota bacterium]